MASRKDAFVIVLPRPEPSFESRVIRIPAEGYLRVLDVKQRTGLSVGEIVERCVSFALDRLEIRREGDTDANT